MKISAKIPISIRLLITLILFTYASTLVDWSSVKQVLQESNIRVLLLAFFVSFPLQVMKILRWKLLLYQKGVHIPFTKLLDYATKSGIHGSITPGRIGEFSKIYYLANENVSKNTTIQTIIYDRLLDIMPMTMLAVIMCQRIHIISSKQILMGVLFFSIAFILFLFTKWRHYFISIFKNTNVCLITVSTLCFLMYVLFNYLVMISIKIKINLLLAGCLASAMSLASIIPVTIAGIGTRDLLVIKLSSLIGITAESMISLSLMDLFFGIALPFIHRGSVVILSYMTKFKKIDQTDSKIINNYNDEKSSIDSTRHSKLFAKADSYEHAGISQNLEEI